MNVNESILNLKKTYLPKFNPWNFPQLDTEGNILYYLGGNANYGFTLVNPDAWTLVDTDSCMQGKQLQSVFGDCNDYQKILAYTNGLSDNLTSFEKRVITQKDIHIDNWNFMTVGELKNAILWPLSRGEYQNNRVVAGKIYEKAGRIWSRSFSGKVGDGSFAHYVCEPSGTLDDFQPITRVYGVVPAFELNLAKVLGAYPAASGTEFHDFVPYHVDCGDIKFLLMDDTIPSFKMEAVKKENRTAIFSFYDVSREMEFLSAMLYDANGKIVYSGDIHKISSNSGEFSFHFPDDLEPGKYIFAVFQQQRNPAMQSDVASMPICFDICFGEDE